jgi:hypothetical protein
VFINSRLVLGAFLVTCAHATTIPIGYLTFGVDSPLAGQTSFGLVNATGPIFGCTIDTPVCDELSIEGTLTIEYAPGDIVVAMLAGPLGAGSFLPPEFIFNDSRVPISATFVGTIAPTTFLHFDGAVYLSDGKVGGDSSALATIPEIIFYTTANPVPIPEPSTLLSMSAVAMVVLAHRRSRR